MKRALFCEILYGIGTRSGRIGTRNQGMKNGDDSGKVSV